MPNKKKEKKFKLDPSLKKLVKKITDRKVGGTQQKVSKKLDTKKLAKPAKRTHKGLKETDIPVRVFGNSKLPKAKISFADLALKRMKKRKKNKKN